MTGVSKDDMEKFIENYLDRMVLAYRGEGQPFEGSYPKERLTAEAMASVREDCERFVLRAGALLTRDSWIKPGMTDAWVGLYGQAATAFWEDRNWLDGGFYSYEWDEAIGKELRGIARVWKPVQPVANPDGTVSLSGS